MRQSVAAPEVRKVRGHTIVAESRTARLIELSEEAGGGTVLVKRCAACRKPATHGVGVALLKGRVGTWYCAEHAP